MNAPIKPLFEEDDVEFSPFGNNGSTIFLRTDRQAPNRKILALDLTRPAEQQWKTVVPESKNAIESALLIGGRLVVHYLADVQSRVAMFGLDGAPQGEMPLPGTGSVAVINGRQKRSEILYSFTSPLSPTTVYSYDPASRARTPFQAPMPPDRPRQVRDEGALCHVEGRHPRAAVRLPAQGAGPRRQQPDDALRVWRILGELPPSYRSDVPAWLEAGGIWVTANLRGGAEYGEAWHKAGMLDREAERVRRLHRRGGLPDS